MKFKYFALALGLMISVPVIAQQGMGNGPHNMRQGRGMGQTLMTQTEKQEMRTQMRNVKTYDECVQLQTDHHAKMEIRAKEKGVTLPMLNNRCDNMKTRGYFK